MDGHIKKGRWQKGQDPNSPLRLLDAKGRPEAFNPGQSWIEVLPSSSPASWTVR
jgi:hypothetical protein